MADIGWHCYLRCSLAAEGKPSGGNAAALEEDDDDDIYGDIAGANIS